MKATFDLASKNPARVLKVTVKENSGGLSIDGTGVVRPGDSHTALLNTPGPNYAHALISFAMFLMVRGWQTLGCGSLTDYSLECSIPCSVILEHWTLQSQIFNMY